MNSCLLSILQSLLFSWHLRILSSTIKVYGVATYLASTKHHAKADR